MPAIPWNRRDVNFVDLSFGFALGPLAVGRTPAGGVKAGRRPPGGLGLDPGEDDAHACAARGEPNSEPGAGVFHAACLLAPGGVRAARARSATLSALPTGVRGSSETDTSLSGIL